MPCSAALDYVEDKQPEFEQNLQKVLSLSPNYGEAYRLAGELASHNYRFDEAVVARAERARARPAQSAARSSDLGTHLLRTGDEQGARTALEQSFKRTSLRRRLLQPAPDDGHAGQVRHRPRRRPHHPHGQGRSAGDAGLGRRARPPGDVGDDQALRVHAEGSDPDRDLPEARRLRRAHARPARHDRRARRVLWPRGHAGFADGACRPASSSGKRRCGTSWRT